MTRQHVTVALSGDGGDELFADIRATSARGAVRTIEGTPQRLRALAACGVRALSPAPGRRSAQHPEQRARRSSATRCISGGRLAGEPEASAFYRQIISSGSIRQVC